MFTAGGIKPGCVSGRSGPTRLRDYAAELVPVSRCASRLEIRRFHSYAYDRTFHTCEDESTDLVHHPINVMEVRYYVISAILCFLNDFHCFSWTVLLFVFNDFHCLLLLFIVLNCFSMIFIEEQWNVINS